MEKSSWIRRKVNTKFNQNDYLHEKRVSGTLPKETFPTFMSTIFVIFLMNLSSTVATLVGGVIGSPAVLKCDTADTPNIELVTWKRNTSNLPFLIYWPAEHITGPGDLDTRFSIVHTSDLAISTLELTDDGTYECFISAPGLKTDLRYTTHLDVLAGCSLWNYTLPLLSETSGCSSGALLDYNHQCIFSCAVGFHMVGNFSTKCEARGVLSNAKPYCEKNSCDADRLPANIQITETCLNETLLLTGMQCSFFCIEGYEIRSNGTFIVICHVDGSFAGSIPDCIITEQEPVEDKPETLVFLSLLSLLIVIPLVLFVTVMCRKRRKQEELSNGQQEHSIEHIPLLEKESMRKFAMLLRDQMRNRPLEKIQLIKFRIVELMNSEEINFIQNISSIADEEIVLPDQLTAEGMFAGYISLLLLYFGKCLNTSQLKNKILAVTDLKYDPVVEENLITTIAESDQTKESIYSYLKNVNKAFIRLVVTERCRMNSKERIKRTAQTARALMSIEERDKTSSSEEDRESIKKSAHSSYWKSKSSQDIDNAAFQESNDCFGEMCLETINSCATITKAIEIRHAVMHALYE